MNRLSRFLKFSLLLTVPTLFISCHNSQPKSGMQMAQKRDIEAQRHEQEVIVIDTDYGDIVILPATKSAPNTSRKFRELAEQGFYDGLAFHFVEPGKIIQGGDINSRDDDPANDGTGDPGFNQEPEISAPNLRGSVGLAHPPDEPNKGNSQFYILLTDMPNLDGRYTVFGIVVDGMSVVEKISRVTADPQGHPLKKVVMKRVYIEKRVV